MLSDSDNKNKPDEEMELISGAKDFVTELYTQKFEKLIK